MIVRPRLANLLLLGSLLLGALARFPATAQPVSAASRPVASPTLAATTNPMTTTAPTTATTAASVTTAAATAASVTATVTTTAASDTPGAVTAAPLTMTATVTATAPRATPTTVAIATITTPVSTAVTVSPSDTLTPTAVLTVTASPTATLSATDTAVQGGRWVRTAGRESFISPAASPGGLSWNTSLTSLPQALSRPAVAVGQNGDIYVFGGTDGTSNDYSTTYIYHPRENAWSQGQNMPVAREGARAITLPDGRIAVLGGGTHCWFSNLCGNGTVYSRVDVYSPSTDTWGALAALQTPRYRFAAVLGTDGHIYAMGGSNGSAALASIEVYTVATNSWSSGTALPQSLVAPSAAVDAGGRIDVIGGFDGGSSYYNTLYVYNAGAWSSGPAMSTPRADLGATLGPDGRIYAIGGATSGSIVSTVEAYNPSLTSWASAPALPGPLWTAGAVTVPSGQIYTVGGGTASGPTAQVAIYGPSIAVTPDGGAPGASTTVLGRGFTPGGSVAVTWGGAGGALLAQATADSSGAITQTVVIPVSAAQGDNTLTAQDLSASYPVTTSYAGGGLTWNASLTTLPGGRRNPAAALGQDGSIYVFGGGDGNSIDYSTTLAYHPGSDTWTQGAPMPAAVAAERAVTLPDGRIVVLGGGAGCFYGQPPCTYSNAVNAYNPQTNLWSALAPMSSARDNFAAVLGPDGRIYAIGGYDGTADLSSVEAFSPTAGSSGTWSPVASLPQAEQAMGAAVGPDGRIYVVGGAIGTGNTVTPNLYIYNPQTNTWTTGPSLPIARTNVGVVTFNATLGPDGRVYVIGGYHSTFGLATGWYAQVDAYNPRTTTWSRTTSLPGQLGEMGVVVTRNGQLFVLGGADGAARGGATTRVSVGTIAFALGGRSPGTRTRASMSRPVWTPLSTWPTGTST